MDILRHKDIIDELVKSGHKIMTTSSEEEKQSMKVPPCLYARQGTSSEWLSTEFQKGTFSVSAVAV